MDPGHEFPADRHHRHLVGQLIGPGTRSSCPSVRRQDEAVFPTRIASTSAGMPRAPPPHLAFGHGPHFCLGAHLAPGQMATLLEGGAGAGRRGWSRPVIRPICAATPSAGSNGFRFGGVSSELDIRARPLTSGVATRAGGAIQRAGNPHKCPRHDLLIVVLSTFGLIVLQLDARLLEGVGTGVIIVGLVVAARRIVTREKHLEGGRPDR